MSLGSSWAQVTKIASTSVSVSIFKFWVGNSRRWARKATCCNDSSPVMYKAGMRWAKLHMSCSNNVLLPAPGCPPMRMAEPGTKPPPKTRSSSLMPVPKRGILATSTSLRSCNCDATPAYPLAALTLALAFTWPPVGAKRISCRLFQAPQSLHCPCHLLLSEPHSLHT